MIVKPPCQEIDFSFPVVFLCGSIEMGKAEEWQKIVGKELGDCCTVLDPRRDDWDSSWIQSIDNEKFVEQVNWELDGIEDSDIILVYFDPNTKSPITLLELGYCVSIAEVVIVCCPKGYWRKGNVDIFCNRQGVLVVESLEELVSKAKECISFIMESRIYENKRR